MRRAATGNVIVFHYVGRLANGDVFDSSVDGQPLKLRLGNGQLVPGVEQALVGMAEGDTKRVKIPAADAYGERRPELVQEIGRDNLQPHVKVKVGSRLGANDDHGRRMELTVVGLTETTVTLDANHPLAGQDLVFDLQLISVAGPTR